MFFQDYLREWTAASQQQLGRQPTFSDLVTLRQLSIYGNLDSINDDIWIEPQKIWW